MLKMETKKQHPGDLFQGKTRNWHFTLFDTEKGDREAKLQELLKSAKYNYIVAGNEISPETGKPHIQGFMMLKNARSRSGLKRTKYWGDVHLRAHLTGEDTLEDSINYCKEDGDFREFGEVPKGQGKRSDLERCAARILDGEELADIYEDHPGTVVRYGRHLKEFKINMMKHRRRAPMTHYCFDLKALQGKIDECEALGKDIYFKPKGKWWTDYRQQSVVVIDEEFYEWKLGSKYEHSVEVKNGTIPFNSPVIIIYCKSDTEVTSE